MYKRILNIIPCLMALFIFKGFIPDGLFDVTEVHASSGYVIDFADKGIAGKANLEYVTNRKYGDTAGSAKLMVTSSSGMETSPIRFPENGISTDWTQVDEIRIPIYSKAANNEQLSILFTKNAGAIKYGYWLYTITIDWTGWREVTLYKSDFKANRSISSWSDINAMRFNIGGWSSTTPQTTTELYISTIEGISLSDSADCNEILENWAECIAGNSETNSLDNAMVKDRLAAIDNNARTIWDQLIKEDGAAELFTGMNTRTTADMTVTADHIYDMALAYATPGCELYKNSELLSDILYALQWFDDNRYQEGYENDRPAWLTGDNNWYQWRIGTPQVLVPIYILLRNDIPAAQMSEFINSIDRLNHTGWPAGTGSNAIRRYRVRLGSALLKKNIADAKVTLRDAEALFTCVDDDPAAAAARDEGFYKDGSYLFHGKHAMNGMYGREHFEAAGTMFAVLEGTSLAMSQDAADAMTGWIENSFDAVIYKNKMPRMLQGRRSSPDELSQSRAIVETALKCFDGFNNDDKIKIGSMIKEYASHNPEKFAMAVSIKDISRLLDIMNSDEYNTYNYENSNVLAVIDKAMHKRPDWAMGVSMSSSRIYNYESISGNNKTGWYLSDGMTELLMGDEGITSSTDYWTGIDYYRLPGTTVDTQEREAFSVSSGNEYLSSKDFVGGAELDRKYVTAAMELESFHNDDTSKAPAHKTDLTAKKSYFMFDNEVFCLGADVHASDNNNAEVLTVIENRNVDGPGSGILMSIITTSGTTSSAFDFSSYGIGNDWSNASKVVLSMYSKEANNEQLNIVLCKGLNTLLDGYYMYKLKVDWQGWKNVEIPISSFDPYRKIQNTTKWNDVNSMYFNIGAWGAPTPQLSTRLVISTLSALDKNGNTIETIDFTNREIAAAANRTYISGIVDNEALTTDSGNISVTEEDTTLTDIKWMNFKNKLGYYFPDDGNDTKNPVKVRLGGCSNYFESWFSHGVNPDNKTYAYALLPNMTETETAAYADDPDVEVLRNTGSVQAVRNKALGITSIVFWEPGTFEGITVSEPMIVMEQKEGRQIKLAVSDPTQKLTSASITFDDDMQLVSGDERITKDSAESRVNIDFSGSLGATYQAELKKKAVEVIVENYDDAGRIEYNDDPEKVTAPDPKQVVSEPGSGKVFMGWYNGDKVRVGTDLTYNVKSEDTKLVAVYAGETYTPKMQTSGKGEAVTDDGTVGHTAGQVYKDTVATIVESVVDIPAGYPVQYIRWQITTDKKEGAATAVYRTDGVIEGACEFAIIIPDVEMDDDTLKIGIARIE